MDYARAVEYSVDERSRCKRFLQLMTDPGDRAHGSITGYSYGCRCPRCSAARLEYDERRRNEEHARS